MLQTNEDKMMRKQPGYEYPNCEIGQIYDMGGGILGEVTTAFGNGAANILVLNGPTKGLTWCVNGQSTSVYKLVSPAK